ncbi:hypothetical protein CAEBREN_08890 [Caenorhabditis brenneri]|uniref:Nuclear transport factor 2-like domain-containing protein n=1 Tax=Caenorhabditis brenneri TaxID=135651 RepID=G0P635_CAEBE|nr:hypothetical protein CAEBREN_08890 [Caenorhabditis brenneri]
MHLPTLTLTILVFIGSSSAVPTDPDAIEVAHNFMKKFMNAIKTEDLMKVLPLISPQPGNTNIDASKLIQELKGFRVSFRGGHFIENNKNEVFVSAIFRAPKTEKASKSADFVLESKAGSSDWTIKSMTDLVAEGSSSKFALPPLVIG